MYIFIPICVIYCNIYLYIYIHIKKKTQHIYCFNMFPTMFIPFFCITPAALYEYLPCSHHFKR